MKKLLSFIMTSLVLVHAHLHADVETEDIGPQHTPTPSNEEVGGPFTIHVYGDAIGKANVHKCGRLGDLSFATGQAEFSFIYYYDPCNQEGLNLTLSYQNTYLDWTRNPYFNQEDYSTVSLTLGGFSKRLCDWIWQGQVSINFDNVEHWDFDDYMNYDLVLWGRYEWCDDVGIHIGFLAQTGMRIDRVYPVVGVDWHYSEKLKLSFVFPLDISATYHFSPCWSLALAGRFFDQRHRVGDHQHLSKGLWSYRSGGGELALNYHLGKRFEANVHAGYNCGGRLKVADRGYHDRRRFKIDGAPYAGADLSLKF